MKPTTYLKQNFDLEKCHVIYFPSPCGASSSDLQYGVNNNHIEVAGF